MYRDFDALMDLALEQAHYALITNDVPVGAIVIDSHGEVIGAACNRREADADPTAHAEVLALRAAAAKLGRWRLDDCTLIVTLEPCAMCAGAIVLSRIPRVIFGTRDLKAGAAGSVLEVLREPRFNHWVEVHTGPRESECGALLQKFFAQRRTTDLE